MNQSRLSSLYEALINVVIGFTINFIANLVILPHVGFNIDMATNFYIGILYTLVSVARQYTIRRWFNARLHAAAIALANLTTKETK